MWLSHIVFLPLSSISAVVCTNRVFPDCSVISTEPVYRHNATPCCAGVYLWCVFPSQPSAGKTDGINESLPGGRNTQVEGTPSCFGSAAIFILMQIFFFRKKPLLWCNLITDIDVKETGLIKNRYLRARWWLTDAVCQIDPTEKIFIEPVNTEQGRVWEMRAGWSWYSNVGLFCVSLWIWI